MGHHLLANCRPNRILYLALIAWVFLISPMVYLEQLSPHQRTEHYRLSLWPSPQVRAMAQARTLLRAETAAPLWASVRRSAWQSAEPRLAAVVSIALSDTLVPVICGCLPVPALALVGRLCLSTLARQSIPISPPDRPPSLALV